MAAKLGILSILAHVFSILLASVPIIIFFCPTFHSFFLCVCVLQLKILYNDLAAFLGLLVGVEIIFDLLWGENMAHISNETAAYLKEEKNRQVQQPKINL